MSCPYILLNPSPACTPFSQVQQNIYLLDFQRVEGDGFSFMNLSAKIITELKTLSAASRQQAQAAQAAQQAMLQQQQQQQQ